MSVDARPTTERLTLVVVPIVLILALLAWGLGHGARPPAPLVGQHAAPFDLRSIDGRDFSLAELQGRVVVLNFWASWCAPCVHEAPQLAEVWNRYANDDRVALLGVLFEDSAAPARAFAQRHGVRWPVLLDPGSRAAIAYGVTGVPETVVVARNGTIVHHVVGEVTAAELLGWIGHELEGTGVHA